MMIEGLHQPPFNTTLLGVLHGALGFYGWPTSPAMTFGGCGHAFLINVHEELCPSGPYCWNREPFVPLVRNLGMAMEDLGFFHAGSSPTDRTAVESRLRDAMDGGLVCALLNLENQLILGYDETGLHTARPWPCAGNFPPDRLTYGTWAELGDEIHVSFFLLRKVPRADDATIARDALAYAVDLYRNPARHTGEHYGVGGEAYDNWARAVAGHGASHGNWWNATVWSECRAMAAAFFAEIGGRYDGAAAAAADDLRRAYEEIAGLLERASDKEMPTDEKVALVRDLKARELAAIDGVEAFIRFLG
jgi:hypothetical protein